MIRRGVLCAAGSAGDGPWVFEPGGGEGQEALGETGGLRSSLRAAGRKNQPTEPGEFLVEFLDPGRGDPERGVGKCL